jgi:hypothetical protein
VCLLAGRRGVVGIRAVCRVHSILPAGPPSMRRTVGRRKFQAVRIVAVARAFRAFPHPRA